MAIFKFTSKQKLIGTIAISFAFFVAEIAVAFLTGSLALLADAFHYMNDLIGFIVALTAIIISERAESPQDFSFGWARASLLGAFFNGAFLLALGISIFLQSIERFISLKNVENPKLVLIMGCIGLTLNIISATLLHEHHEHDHGHGHAHGHTHDHGGEYEHSHSSSHSYGAVDIETGMAGNDSLDEHPMTPISAHAEHRHVIANMKSPGRDLGMMGVFIHVIGDALNNVGVIIAALVIWLTSYDARFYADPGVSMGIAIMILLSCLPLVKNSGKILMQSAPRGVDLDDVKHDLEKIPGIDSVHELHIWRLDQKKSIASAHVVVSNDKMSDFMESAKTVTECLHAYGIHSATLQPELAVSPPGSAIPTAMGAASSVVSSSRRRRAEGAAACQMVCGDMCGNLMCCTTTM
ncbi:cation efflux protein [Pseudomassariella vexata]|uniref:Cation efflux protein n=1 Tax=Pseudomassariella vexata TaxID=1141098 RepID=A0A1Y2DZX9_9PEZI|nr:cation efflux protein [Pseudomassariella vexata]ORY64779.1 cation efflux protein [Pseudomassariella vexata]